MQACKMGGINPRFSDEINDWRQSLIADRWEQGLSANPLTRQANSTAFIEELNEFKSLEFSVKERLGTDDSSYKLIVLN